MKYVWWISSLILFHIQVNNIAEELKLNLEKIGQGNVNGDGDSGDSNSAGSDSVDDKEDCVSFCFYRFLFRGQKIAHQRIEPV